MNKRREIPRLDITLKVVEIKYTNVWQYISSFERQICCWLMVFYIIASSFLLRQGKQNSLVVAFFTPIAHTPCSCFNTNLIRIIYKCIPCSEILFLNVNSSERLILKTIGPFCSFPVLPEFGILPLSMSPWVIDLLKQR